MIAATVQGVNGWLVPYPPNTLDPVRVTASIEVDGQRGLTGRRSGRPQAVLLRYELSWTVALYPNTFHQARLASIAAQDEPIFAPFWPAALPVGTAAVLTAGSIVAWTSGFTTWAIDPPSLVPYSYYAPVLWGRLKQAPRLAGRTPQVVIAEWTLHEDSPSSAAIRPPVQVDSTYLTPGGYAAAIFPWGTEGSTPPEPSFGAVDTERSQVGPGRQQTTVFYPQTPEQGLKAFFKFKSSTAAFSLLSWWQRRSGQADAFWIAQPQKIGDLANDLAAGAVTLPFTAPPGTLSGETLALFGPGSPIEITRSTAIAGNNVTVPPLVNPRTAWATVVAPAMLVAHTDAQLEMEFNRSNNDWTAEATLSFRECASEYLPTSEEAIGTTLGRLPPPAWFYQVDLDYAGAVQSTYLTSWEGGATIGSQVWTYNDCKFDKITWSIDLQDDGCEFTMRWFDGCPWTNWLPGNLAARGYLTIYRADVSPTTGAIGALAAVWKGELTVPTIVGPNVKAKVMGASAIFQRKAPKQIISPSCGTFLFFPRCGLVLANWTFTAVVTAVGSNTVTVNTVAWPQGALPALLSSDPDYFALGWLGWTAGGLPLRGGCLTNTALAGGSLVMTLDRPVPVTVGQGVTLVPGCNRLGPTCRTKFNNYANFRGFENVPAVDPCFIIPQQNTNPAKK